MTFPERYKDFEFNLLPCPFCGGRPRMDQKGFPIWITCTVCGAKVHGQEDGIPGAFASVNIWNARAKYERAIRRPEEVR